MRKIYSILLILFSCQLAVAQNLVQLSSTNQIMKNVMQLILILIPLMGISQTGPGGVGANDGSSTLEYWIDANGGVTGTSLITAWTDLSGNSITNTINGNPCFNNILTEWV